MLSSLFVVCLVSLVYPVRLIQPSKQDKPNTPGQPAGSHASRVSSMPLAGFFKSLIVMEVIQSMEGL